MIRAVMILNTRGQPHLVKFYQFQPTEKQQELIRSVYGVLSERAENVSSFVQVDSIFGPDSKLVYKHLATLNFVIVFDSSENELAMLDLIQVFVETLDRCFKNVCELDIVFNFQKVGGGEVFSSGPRAWVEFSSFLLMGKDSRFLLDVCGLLGWLEGRAGRPSAIFKRVLCFLLLEGMQWKMHAILDEIIFAGQVIETSSEDVMKAVEEIARLEKSSNATSLIPNSISGRLGL